MYIILEPIKRVTIDKAYFNMNDFQTLYIRSGKKNNKVIDMLQLVVRAGALNFPLG